MSKHKFNLSCDWKVTNILVLWFYDLSIKCQSLVKQVNQWEQRMVLLINICSFLMERQSLPELEITVDRQIDQYTLLVCD